LNQAQQNQAAQCGPFETACGTYNGARGKRALECVDTRSDLESCGGCSVSSPFSDPSDDTPRGVDCSAIEGVADVSCRNSRCAVSSCMSGYSVSATGDSCISDAQLSGAIANSTDDSSIATPTDLSMDASSADLSTAFGLASSGSSDSDENLSGALTTPSTANIPSNLNALTGNLATPDVDLSQTNEILEDTVSQTDGSVESLAKDLAAAVPDIDMEDEADIEGEVDSELEADVEGSMDDADLDEVLSDINISGGTGGG
jgi:hypothetical protein